MALKAKVYTQSRQYHNIFEIGGDSIVPYQFG